MRALGQIHAAIPGSSILASLALDPDTGLRRRPHASPTQQRLLVPGASQSSLVRQRCNRTPSGSITSPRWSIVGVVADALDRALIGIDRTHVQRSATARLVRGTLGRRAPAGSRSCRPAADRWGCLAAGGSPCSPFDYAHGAGAQPLGGERNRSENTDTVGLPQIDHGRPRCRRWRPVSGCRSSRLRLPGTERPQHL